MSTALITGASGGIGKAFAEELAARNTHLVLVARSEEKLNQLAKYLQEKHNIQVDSIVADLTEAGSTDTVFNTVTEKGLTVDMLINNAGFGDYGDFAKRDRERHLKILQLNVLALVDLTHRFLQGMRQQGSGSIINISSLSAFQPIPYVSVYSASKAFILNFSQSLWAENKSYGVRVLVVCPGPVETNFFVEAKFPQALAAKTSGMSTSEEVVREALKALERGDSTVVTGGFTTHFISKFARFVPRQTLLFFLEKQFKNDE
ncbi:SDR family NAD(P)-dependent oxidoreductase [Scytonema sp. UIC 10036]|uniref:SDR family NAD(P)-dependent oxidoreductase n=1 Tax=Scytonema sp. UIC 10036 TaxID=2304196 RepID=UPI0012DA5A40|nr:SDR family oxidoreductase [Scytonema sp. UIC 10036]MUG94216.1 SDR family NAD(P)-dependent oxidoreductase [Scytonema sp. UIC 10036]